MTNDVLNHAFELPEVPTGKRRIVFSFGMHDAEFFKCFPSDYFLGARYDRNPAQLVIVWSALLKQYHCDLQIFNPRNQLLLSFPISKSVNLPYTIVDGMINEWITKEEFVYFQFVFTGNGGEFVKSTLPIRMNFSGANRPDFSRIGKPVDIDKMKVLYDQAVTEAVLRFDAVKGWVYDFFAQDGTLRFSLAWIPANVVRGSAQVLTANEKMTARENLGVTFTFVLPVLVSDGNIVSKSTTAFVDRLINATMEVWKDNGDGSFTEVVPVSKTYSDSGVVVELTNSISGYIRVSCVSRRIVPDEESAFLESGYSGNVIMDENGQEVVVAGGQDE